MIIFILHIYDNSRTVILNKREANGVDIQSRRNIPIDNKKLKD